MRTPHNNCTDPLTELFNVASALLLMKNALHCMDECEAQVPASGLAHLHGLLGDQIHSLATELWEIEGAAPPNAEPAASAYPHQQSASHAS